MNKFITHTIFRMRRSHLKNTESLSFRDAKHREISVLTSIIKTRFLTSFGMTAKFIFEMASNLLLSKIRRQLPFVVTPVQLYTVLHDENDIMNPKLQQHFQIRSSRPMLLVHADNLFRTS